MVKKADCVEADAEVVDVVVMALLVVADSSDSSSAFRLRVLGFFAGGDAGADADDADRRDGAMAPTEGDAEIVELRLIPVSVAVAVDEHGGVLLLLGRKARGEARRGDRARRHEVSLRRGRCQTVPNPRVATADTCDVAARGVHE